MQPLRATPCPCATETAFDRPWLNRLTWFLPFISRTLMVQIDTSAHRIRRPEPNHVRPERIRSLLKSTIQIVIVVLWVSISWAASGSGRIDPPEKASGQRKQLSPGLDMHDGITLCLQQRRHEKTPAP